MLAKYFIVALISLFFVYTTFAAVAVNPDSEHPGMYCL